MDRKLPRAERGVSQAVVAQEDREPDDEHGRGQAEIPRGCDVYVRRTHQPENEVPDPGHSEAYRNEQDQHDQDQRPDAGETDVGDEEHQEEDRNKYRAETVAPGDA